MVIKTIDFEDIAPFVRFASNLQFNAMSNQATAISYDHRLIYVVNGSGMLIANDKEIEIGPGYVLYWPSGTTYALHPNEDETLNLIIVNFDFMQENTDLLQPLPAVTPQSYDPNSRLEQISFTNAAVFESDFVLTNVPAILPYLQTISEEAETPQILNHFQLTNLMRVVLTVLYRVSYTHLDRKSSDSFNKILDYVYEHYTLPLSNKDLAIQFNYHPNYLNKRMAQYTGETLHQYLISYRIARAIDLLATTDDPISSIATAVGFRDICHFTRLFREKTGLIPSAYRKRQ